MRKKLVDEVAAIEAPQEALRESIEQTRALAEKTDELLKDHKENLKKEADRG